MNTLILFMLGMNLVLLPLVAYLALRTLDSKARRHRQALIDQLDWLLRAHENRVATRSPAEIQW